MDKTKILIIGMIIPILLVSGCIGTKKPEEAAITSSTTTTLEEYRGPYKEAVEMVKTNVSKALEICKSLSNVDDKRLCNIDVGCEAQKVGKVSDYCQGDLGCEKLAMACENPLEAVEYCDSQEFINNVKIPKPLCEMEKYKDHDICKVESYKDTCKLDMALVASRNNFKDEALKICNSIAEESRSDKCKESISVSKTILETTTIIPKDTTPPKIMNFTQIEKGIRLYKDELFATEDNSYGWIANHKSLIKCEIEDESEINSIWAECQCVGFNKTTHKITPPQNTLFNKTFLTIDEKCDLNCSKGYTKCGENCYEGYLNVVTRDYQTPTNCTLYVKDMYGNIGIYEYYHPNAKYD